MPEGGPDTGTVDVGGEGGLRVVIAGKGGVGKSTLCALLARTLARSGARVVAVDADEQRNLGATLGVDLATLSGLTPLVAQADYIEEKVGARPGEGAGAMLRLNPDTADVVERLSIGAPDGIRLLVMGGVQRAGGGCLCPEHALVAAVMANMRLRDGEVIVMDTHAGVEHFGRALARGFDRALVVMDPTFNAAQVAVETARLARELGIGDVELIVNRCRDDADFERAWSYVNQLGGFPFSSVTALPVEPALFDGEPSVAAILDWSMLAEAVTELAERLRASADTSRHDEFVGRT